MNESLIAAAELGDEAKRFLESDLGKCVLGFAAQEVELAREKLGTISPADTEAIRALQATVRLNQQFGQWLIELLQEGENALSAFRQQQETES